MKFLNFYFNPSFLKLPFSLLFFFIAGSLFSQTGMSSLAKSYLEAEVILQKEFSPKRLKEEILKHNKIAKEDFAGFKEFVLSEYSKDKHKFFSDYTTGKLIKTNLPSYFSFLRAKYISSYNAYLSHKNNDDFTLFYKKGIGGNEMMKKGNGGDEVKSPGQPCNNMDIEQCDFTSWELYTGDVPGTSQYSYTNVSLTSPGAQHTITTGGNDPVVPVPQLYPDGGSCSVRLGDGTGTGAKGASMKQTFMVDSNNAVFTYSYAVILEDPGTSHSMNEKPYFRVRIYDSGNISIPCGEYNVIAGPATSGGDPDMLVQGNIQYKDWTTVFAPLNGYIGQNVTAEFVVGDCSQGGHYGYAYVEASCQPLEIISSSPVICGGQTVTLTAPPGAATYAWSGPSGNYSTQSITTSTPGTYNVVVTPVSGSACAITLTTTLPTNPSIPVANFSSSSPCIGNPTQFTDLSSVSPGTIAEWHWDFGASGIADTSNLQNPAYTYITAGNYNVTLSVTTDGGCVEDTTLSVNVISSFDASFTPDTFCNDEPPANLSSVSAGGVWSGTGITNTTNGTFNPTAAGLGTFPITYMGGTGACQDTFIANVIVDGVAINSVSTTNVTCFGDNDGTLTVSATGAAQYSINNGSGPILQINGNFSGLSPGTYSIIVTSAINNCQKTSTATITEPPQLVMAFQTFDVTCFNACDGEAISIPSGGTSPYNYAWTSGTGNAATTGKTLCDGAYTLSITDAKGCEIDTTFVITEPADYSIVLSTVNSNCGHPDGSAEIISISGQTPPYSYSWSNGDLDSSNTTVVNGNYTVTITDANNCNTVMAAVVGFNPPPDASATGVVTSCFGVCDGNATVLPSNGTTPGQYTYLWNNGQTTVNATALCAGSYTVTVYDLNFCEGYASVVVPQPTPVVVDPFVFDTICIDSSTTITAIANGGTSPYTYLWDNTMTGATITVNPATQTCYSVTATDNNGCVSNPQVQCISIFPPLNLMASGTTTICEGFSVDISAFAFGGNPNNSISYQWDDGITDQFRTVTPPGNVSSPKTYTVTASDGCAPPVSDAVVISFYPQPTAILVADTTKGCEPVPEFSVIFSNISSNLNNPLSCVWSISDGSDPIQDCDTFIHFFPNVGQYDVSLTVISENACQSSVTMPDYITVYPNPVADFEFAPQPTDVQNMNIKFSDLSTGITVNQWKWSFYDNDATTLAGNGYFQNPVFNFASEPDNPFIYYLSDTGNYPVTLWIKTDKNCMDSITKTVKIDGVFYVNVPNAFTPNNDGINDYFFPSGVGIQPSEEFRFLIFDRWGDIIFESKSLDDPWDGTARSLGGKTLVKQDVYVWRLELKDVTREQENHKYFGRVTLLK